MTAPATLFEKIWRDHIVVEEEGRPPLLYIDTHLVHEVTSAQAFEGLRLAGRVVRRPNRTFATADHNVPTTDRSLPVLDDFARRQLEALESNCAEFKIPLFHLGSPLQGIVHVIGPELGITQPGATIVCGDSHTSTHGAFGALAFGIGTSEVEHVLATQCLVQARPQTMRVRFTGRLPAGTSAKDMILYLIRRIGIDGATGHVLEYSGPAIESLSMEERMTVCNMSIEAGARAGMVAPDGTTFDYLEGRPNAPAGAEFNDAVDRWRRLPTDPGAEFDRELQFDIGKLAPQVSWGTSPAMVTDVTGTVPDPSQLVGADLQAAAARALEYMDLEPGTPISEIRVDRVFIGSCTNSRIEDLREAAQIALGRRVRDGVHAMVVPGSQQIKAQAEKEGLADVFRAAGFDWRESGCSMCLGMNPDILESGQRCASTSNRNFEGRQGKGGRTHLVSPAMAAAAAVEGRFVDVRELG